MAERATTVQIVQIYQKLEQLLEKAGEGMVQYPAGWNDQKVADEFGVSKWSVHRVRTENFGKIYQSGPGAQIAALEERISVLEEYIIQNGMELPE
jgi:AraC-like DNA-binding protein